MQDLPQDLIGTNPKFLPIVDHSWLNPQGYDNYPSDNNSVRTLPKLSELWGTGKDTGIHLIPNTEQPLCIRASESSSTENIVRETKKAMMMGLKGKNLVSHIKARFVAEDIKKADEALKKLADEQGLLGNVYVDASAFITAPEAEQFFTQHRNRLAKDILVNGSALNPSVIGYLASKFHKDVVASITYDESLFKKYKTHMVAAGHISSDAVIDSKETLRQAFLSEPEKKVPEVKKVTEKKIPIDVEAAAKSRDLADKAAQEELSYGRLRPIIVFARQNFAKGITGANLKDMLRKKFIAEDLNKSVKYLAVVLSKEDMSEKIDKLATEDKITSKIGKDLKDIMKSSPLKKETCEKQPCIKESVGVRGHFYSMNSVNTANDEHCEYAKELLRKGSSLEEVEKKLFGRVPDGKINDILLAAVKEFNLMPVAKANVFVKAKKEKLFEDEKKEPALPDPKTIFAQTQEIFDFYKGANMDIELNPISDEKSLDIDISGGANYESIL